MFTNTRSHMTAMARRDPSAPTRYAVKKLHPRGRVLDLGCGRGKDVEHMQSQGWDAVGYDPKWQPTMPDGKFGLVVCNYVLNVVTPSVRLDVLRTAHDVLQPDGTVFVSARSHKAIERARGPRWETWQDGYVTGSGTFQHGLTQDELRDLLCEAGFVPCSIDTWSSREAVLAMAQKPN